METDGQARLSPSLLAADFTRLGEEIAAVEAAGVDAIHIDVMDGHFVPNISLGLPIVAAARRATRLPLDVHLMIDRPERYLEEFINAGAGWITVHVEGAPNLDRTLERIHELGALAGVAVNPGTPVTALEEALARVDFVLVMTVNPGFGGQRFIERQLVKVAHTRAAIERLNPRATLAVDGGITRDNVGAVVTAGAGTIVAGSAVFGTGQPAGTAVAGLRAAMSRGFAARPGIL